MRGYILGRDHTTSQIFIKGQNGERYTAPHSQWKEDTPPSKGEYVDFDISKDNEAHNVFREITIPQDITNISSLNMWEIALKCFKNTFNFRGRASRREYWMFFAFKIIMLIFFEYGGLLGDYEIKSLHDHTISWHSFYSEVSDQTDIYSILITLIFTIPSLSVQVRRLHDRHLSGWWVLLSFTLIGEIPIFILNILKTKPETNRWGPPAV
ncbi:MULTISPECIES: DUF805 domain-containing protein [unclassified Saccharibacter]|uniref:DUF805 domain-containing protein n=1 Tax=unclassified Saccharibacter TaxID=2648722 RepID=UPI001323EEFB|nr:MULTISPECIES: DUF805 domain-containing protein [unclassified Saccharibacter]MXV36583.1 DUF805 domain-containing protein [Saccharibacter sp. EH611]MXV57745.1 DUF805 domain-containing protein [Saccharibacter sp. EH70]MXV64948.1 DUF805 domain-containing protein [Saccharibacter sp. EH60]